MVLKNFEGHTASLTHRVQRSYGLGWDIRADHPDVPAIFTSTLKWHPAKPRTGMTTHLFVRFPQSAIYSRYLAPILFRSTVSVLSQN